LDGCIALPFLTGHISVSSLPSLAQFAKSHT
jgi:hypothetical protein